MAGPPPEPTGGVTGESGTRARGTGGSPGRDLSL